MKRLTRKMWVSAPLAAVVLTVWAGADAGGQEKADGAAGSDSLVSRLGDRDAAVRDGAEGALLALGRPVLRSLRKGIQSGDPEVRRRSRALVEVIDADAIAIRGSGGDVRIDGDNPDETILEVDLTHGFIGSDADLARVARFDTLRTLALGGPRITNAGMARLSGLKHLKKLGLRKTAVTDRGMAAIGTLHQLESLGFNGTQITDDGLAHLAALKCLADLELNGTAVTDAGLTRLKVLSNLNTLDLDDTEVTDDGLENIKSMTQLTCLSLNHTRITDAGLKRLKGLHLSGLLLYDTAITDAGLPSLAAFPHMRVLNLDKTRITDGGLASLAELHELCVLQVVETKVTHKGLDALKRSLPRLYADGARDR